MLVLTRKQGEEIHIGNEIVVKVIKTGRSTVKLGIEAPREVRVIRGELNEGLSVAEPAANRGLKKSAVMGLHSDQFPHVI